MQDQHTKIKGYRDLSQLEIDLMNELKSIEAQICAPEAYESIKLRYCQALHKAGFEGFEMAQKLNTFEANWQNAHTFLQTGFMWAVRAIAQPQPTKAPEKIVWHAVDKVTIGDDMLADDAQLLVESSYGRSLMVGADLKAVFKDSSEADPCNYVRFIFLDKLPA